jgi:hypothetical protein
MSKRVGELRTEPCDGCGKPLSGGWLTDLGYVCDDCYRHVKAHAS